MPLINRILCATDFSDAAREAFQFADQLAQEMHAELLLVHAFDKPAALTVAAQSVPSDPHLQEKLDAIQSAFPDARIRRRLHAGPPGEVICWLAANESCDLIVMGTHGRSGLRHLVLGSVAEFVVRHARSPVLTVRLPSDAEPPLKEPRVLPIPAPRLM
jgi:nucleotide-binding universal stress UspA family protein